MPLEDLILLKDLPWFQKGDMFTSWLLSCSQSPLWKGFFFSGTLFFSFLRKPLLTKKAKHFRVASLVSVSIPFMTFFFGTQASFKFILNYRKKHIIWTYWIFDFFSSHWILTSVLEIKLDVVWFFFKVIFWVLLPLRIISFILCQANLVGGQAEYPEYKPTDHLHVEAEELSLPCKCPKEAMWLLWWTE